jgi:hypothetical protein
VIAEFWPHLALILYRVYPARKHFLGQVFRLTSVSEVVGTTIETAIAMWLFGSLWQRWTLPFKVVTPCLHLLFSVAQLWGARVFWKIANTQFKEARIAEYNAGEVLEAAQVVGDEHEEYKEA